MDARNLSLAEKFDVVILTGVIAHLDDVQLVFNELHKVCHESTRVIVGYYNMVWGPLLKSAEFFGLKMPQAEINWLSTHDVTNLLYLSGFETIKDDRRILFPKYIPLISDFLNSFVATLPGIRKLCLNHYVIARGAIPENLLESELFGHVRGAFTGAVRDHQGLLEAADGGTAFLDEIGEIPPAAQVRLLRFLQEGESRRVGDANVRKLDVRIIAARNRNLDEAIQDGSFREDLFFRLNVIPIFLPPLRERKEDIPPLAAHLLQRLCDAHSRNVTGLSPEALRAFMNYRWPGNVREMENMIEYALHLTDEGNP